MPRSSAASPSTAGSRFRRRRLAVNEFKASLGSDSAAGTLALTPRPAAVAAGQLSLPKLDLEKWLELLAQPGVFLPKTAPRRRRPSPPRRPLLRQLRPSPLRQQQPGRLRPSPLRQRQPRHLRPSLLRQQQPLNLRPSLLRQQPPRRLRPSPLHRPPPRRLRPSPLRRPPLRWLRPSRGAHRQPVAVSAAAQRRSRPRHRRDRLSQGHVRDLAIALQIRNGAITVPRLKATLPGEMIGAGRCGGGRCRQGVRHLQPCRRQAARHAGLARQSMRAACPRTSCRACR